MNKNYDTAVIGLGAMGLATTYELSQRGHKVLGLEQFLPLHSHGSSHGETRVIRRAYFEHSDYIPLLNRSYQLWEKLEQDSSQKIFEKCGLVIFANPQTSVIYKESLSSARKYSIKIEELAPEFIKKNYSYLMPPSEFWGLRESEAGFLYVDKALKSYQTLASSHGAQLNFEEKILSLNADGAMGVEIQTNKNRYWVEKLIITAGSWGGPLLQSLNLALPLKVYRVYLSWFACDKKHFLNQGASCFALHLEGDDFYYGFPCLDGKSLKLAAHFAKDLIKKPEDKEVNTPDNYKLEQMQKMIGRHLPHVEQKLLQFSTCLYTNTPDENFIIDTHSQFPQISFALGFSGHGFKFAPVVGEILADLSEKGQSSLAIDFLKLSRFANP